MSLHRQVLDGLACAHDGHSAEACDNNVLYFHAACHMRAQLEVSYDKTTGDLTVRCGDCDSHVATVAVARQVEKNGLNYMVCLDGGQPKCRQCRGTQIDPSSGHDGTKKCRWCEDGMLDNVFDNADVAMTQAEVIKQAEGPDALVTVVVIGAEQ